MWFNGPVSMQDRVPTLTCSTHYRNFIKRYQHSSVLIPLDGYSTRIFYNAEYRQINLWKQLMGYVLKADSRITIEKTEKNGILNSITRSAELNQGGNRNTIQIIYESSNTKNIDAYRDSIRTRISVTENVNYTNFIDPEETVIFSCFATEKMTQNNNIVFITNRWNYNVLRKVIAYYLLYVLETKDYEDIIEKELLKEVLEYMTSEKKESFDLWANAMTNYVSAMIRSINKKEDLLQVDENKLRTQIKKKLDANTDSLKKRIKQEESNRDMDLKNLNNSLDTLLKLNAELNMRDELAQKMSDDIINCIKRRDSIKSAELIEENEHSCYLKFTSLSEITDYDKTAFNQLTYYVSITRYNKYEATEILNMLEEIFIKENYRVVVQESLKLAISRDTTGNRNRWEKSNTDIGISNPHHESCNCFGQYNNLIDRAIAESKYSLAFDYFMASISSFDFNDDPVSSFFVRVIQEGYYKNKCLRDVKTDELYTFDELNEILNKKKGEENE